MFSLALIFLILFISFSIKELDKNLDSKHYSVLEQEKKVFEDKINALLIANDGYKEEFYFSGYREGIKITLNMTNNILILNSSRAKAFFTFPSLNASFQIDNGTLLFYKKNNDVGVKVI